MQFVNNGDIGKAVAKILKFQTMSHDLLAKPNIICNQQGSRLVWHDYRSFKL